VLFIVVKEGKILTDQEVNIWIHEQLSKYKWPSHTDFVTELPRTPSSKIEKFKFKNGMKDEFERNEESMNQ
jgi:acyl-coenzyme A synthetase/AMP-(fatty) acid ligase